MTRDFSETVAVVLKNKTKRNRAILAILIVALVFLYGGLLFNRAVQRGAKRYLFCEKCRERLVRRIKNIDEERCDKCGGPLKFVFKCSDCAFEFPFLHPELPPDADEKELVHLHQIRYVCPNCGSNKIWQMPVPPEER